LARKCRTFSFDIYVDAKSSSLDLSDSKTDVINDADLLGVECGCVEFRLSGDKVGTELISFPTDMKSKEIVLKNDEEREVPTHDVDIPGPDRIGTKRVESGFPGIGEKIINIPCRPDEKIKTFSSPYLDHAPQRRFIIDMKKIPFPVLSEYMSELAARNKTSYTNIKFIGAFDPIPLHLAEKLTLDTGTGILKFHIRNKPEGERRFVRVVYGKKRSDGQIVSAIFPVK